MSDQKFFSGLTDEMMTRGKKNAPDRQQTNFFWPDETDKFVPSRQSRNQSSTASLISQPQACTNTEVSQNRKPKPNQSKIEFYDVVEVNSRSNELTKRKHQEMLKPPKEFYLFGDMKDQHGDDDQLNNNSEPSVIEHKITVTLEP